MKALGCEDGGGTQPPPFTPPEPEASMRYFQPPADTRFYAGVDLHARSLYLAVLDRDGQRRFGRNLPAAPGPFLKAVEPFRGGLVVGCECMPCWYWLADTCREQHIDFVLGHAWGMKAVHGSKTKCDRHDAEAIARLLRGGWSQKYSSTKRSCCSLCERLTAQPLNEAG